MHPLTALESSFAPSSWGLFPRHAFGRSFPVVLLKWDSILKDYIQALKVAVAPLEQRVSFLIDPLPTWNLLANKPAVVAFFFSSGGVGLRC